MTFILFLVAFLAGAFYAQHDWSRMVVAVVVALLLWSVVDEIKETS